MADTPHILQVEDDADIREITKLALEALGGLSVAQVASGGQALAEAPAVAPDLLLMDMTLPDMDGVQTMNALRELPGLEDVPTIFMTARAQYEEHEILIQAGAIGVIPKPFDAMTLAQDVLEIWEGRAV
ncbi:response regulator [Thalassovita sp.]|jgi:CheY-like chemotaxis protein|uniref:response regulator n=1 Tax=Thalassovita sp. TaxID=1979401 RepID=UPI003B5B74BA